MQCAFSKPIYDFQHHILLFLKSPPFPASTNLIHTQKNLHYTHIEISFNLMLHPSPHLLNQSLSLLPTNHPSRHPHFHPKQRQYKHPHIPHRELIQHDLSLKHYLAYFPANHNRSRNPDSRSRQYCGERIAQPLADIHFT